jgi:hypothetical protein
MTVFTLNWTQNSIKLIINKTIIKWLKKTDERHERPDEVMAGCVCSRDQLLIHLLMIYN